MALQNSTRGLEMEFPELLGFWGCGGGDQIHIFIPFIWSQVDKVFREIFREVFGEVFPGTWRAEQCEMALGRSGSQERSLIPHHSQFLGDRQTWSREQGRG